MRKLISILFLLALVGAAHAATRIEAWISITNLPNANTNSLTWNTTSNRLWTNIIFNASTMIQTTNNIQNSRTNLKVNLDTYKFRNWHVVNYGTNTNDVVILAGTNEPIAIAIAGLWASVRYVTNTAYISDFVLAPPHSGQSNNFLIWQWTAVATNLSKGTQALEKTSFPFTNFPHTLRTSNPPMTNMNTAGGTNFGGVAKLVSGQFINVGLSNVVGTNVSFPGTGASSQQIGAGALATGDNSIAFGVGALTTNSSTIAIGKGAIASDTAALAVGDTATAFGAGSFAFGFESLATTNDSIAFGSSAASQFKRAVAIGAQATTTADNQVRLGTATWTVSIPGNADIIGTNTAGISYATNFDAASAVIHTGLLTGLVVTATSSADLTGVTMRTGNATGTVAHFTTLRGTTLTTLANGIIGNDLTVTNEAVFYGDATFAAAVNILSSAITVKDLNTTGTNKFALAISFTATNITSLANGVNLVDPGLKTFIRVSGPTAAYSLDKMTRGYDGRFVRIHKNDSFTLTLANESGSGGGAATDRLVTGTGANITVTNNPGVVEFTYDATLGRWVLGYHSL